MSQILINKILELKQKKNAIILAHNYQIPEVQDIADFIGDSLDLSQKAAKTNADVIMFCGVHFMAETASILCPDKIVLMSDLNAGCPMANMITAKDVQELKNKNKDAMVVCYINTTAEVKAESDVCCTSANAVKIINSLKAKKIIFIPDKYLGQYVANQTKKEMIFWEGYCPIHVKILENDILNQKKKYPNAKVIIHPECTPEVIRLADEVLSTSGMCRYAKKTECNEIIVGTEIGLTYRLQKENPNKKFYSASNEAICSNMKKHTLEKILWAFEEMKNEVKVSQEIRNKAINAVNKMLEIGS